MKKSLFYLLLLFVGSTMIGCTDNTALQEQKEKEQEFKDTMFEADMIRCEELKRKASRGDDNALNEWEGIIKKWKGRIEK